MARTNPEHAGELAQSLLEKLDLAEATLEGHRLRISEEIDIIPGIITAKEGQKSFDGRQGVTVKEEDLPDQIFEATRELEIFQLERCTPEKLAAVGVKKPLPPAPALDSKTISIDAIRAYLEQLLALKKNLEEKKAALERELLRKKEQPPPNDDDPLADAAHIALTVSYNDLASQNLLLTGQIRELEMLTIWSPGMQIYSYTYLYNLLAEQGIYATIAALREREVFLNEFRALLTAILERIRSYKSSGGTEKLRTWGERKRSATPGEETDAAVAFQGFVARFNGLFGGGSGEVGRLLAEITRNNIVAERTTILGSLDALASWLDALSSDRLTVDNNGLALLKEADEKCFRVFDLNNAVDNAGHGVIGPADLLAYITAEMRDEIIAVLGVLGIEDAEQLRTVFRRQLAVDKEQMRKGFDADFEIYKNQVSANLAAERSNMAAAQRVARDLRLERDTIAGDRDEQARLRAAAEARVVELTAELERAQTVDVDLAVPDEGKAMTGVDMAAPSAEEIARQRAAIVASQRSAANPTQIGLGDMSPGAGTTAPDMPAALLGAETAPVLAVATTVQMATAAAPREEVQSQQAPAPSTQAEVISRQPRQAQVISAVDVTGQPVAKVTAPSETRAETAEAAALSSEAQPTRQLPEEAEEAARLEKTERSRRPTASSLQVPTLLSRAREALFSPVVDPRTGRKLTLREQASLLLGRRIRRNHEE